MTTLNAVDGAGLKGMSSSTISCLKSQGITSVFAYIVGSYAWSAADITNARNAGLNVFLVYETNPTSAGYFTSTQGTNDANAAINALFNLQIPTSTGATVFFAVDYDAQAADEAGIQAYFNAIANRFAQTGGGDNPYQVGIYGGYNPLDSVRNHCPGVVGFWQTYAWSNGYVHNYLDAYQYSNGHTLCSVGVDYDDVYSTVHAI